MCGITGSYGLSDSTLLKKMTDVIKHRGPDDEGFFIDDNVGLGMRRLSIIDIEGGKQPIHNEDESIWIVFNGEVYNFLELRRGLIEKGHRFYTNTDTEVIVHAYEEYGEDFVNKLRGMFAFAIWDSNEKKLILARDRVGIKPLYYAFINGAFFFGSEIKSILQYDGYVPQINFQALHDYLSYLYVPAPSTIFVNIYKLPPAHMLVIRSDGIVEIKRYWDLEFPESSYSEEYYIKGTRELLEESVRIHMISDVPIGVYLSGGIDSSTIVSLMSRHSEEPIKTFTVGFYDEEFSELKYARQVAEFFDTEHHEIILEPDVFKLLPKIVRQHDEPFGNSTSIIHYLISEYIYRKVKVALSGAGGDEVFAGYPKYLGMRLAEYYNKIPSIVTKPFEKLLYLLPESKKERDYIRWGKMFVESAHFSPDERYYNMIRYFSEKEKERLYSEDFKKHHKFKNSSYFVKEIFNKAKTNDYEKKTFYAEINSFLPYNILEYGDKTSMAASIEARVPFLDHELIEFSATIPYSIKLKRLQLKYVLKMAMKPYLPKFVLKRKKMGFNPPTGLWLDRDLQELVDGYLSNDIIKERKIFDYKYINRLIQEHKAGRRNNGLRIWSLIVFEEWYRQYIEGGTK